MYYFEEWNKQNLLVLKVLKLLTFIFLRIKKFLKVHSNRITSNDSVYRAEYLRKENKEKRKYL
jgi:hypothetical protein